MIYQLVKKKTEILEIATTHIAHFCNQHNYVFNLLISMPRFNSINKFYQNRPKLKLVFVKNRQNFQSLGTPPPDLRNNPPPIADFWLRA